MKRSCSKSWYHFVWWGSIAAWSMSGLVTTTWPAARIVWRTAGARVPVVDAGREVDAGQLGEGAQPGQLVLAQRLGREEVERPRRRVVDDCLQDRQVVAERLARCRRRHHAGVEPGMEELQRLGLVAVERLDAALAQAGAQPLVEPAREGPQVGLASGQGAVGDDRVGHEGIVQQALDDGRHLGPGMDAHRSASVIG